MAAVYEDNFGFWEIDGPNEQAFFEYVQRQSVEKTCCRCERTVRLMSPKTLCASCHTALECGAPASMNQYWPLNAIFASALPRAELDDLLGDPLLAQSPRAGDEFVELL
jgi:hypothetical protein